MARRTIKFKRSAVTRTPIKGGGEAFTIEVSVDTATGVPREVFVMRRLRRSLTPLEYVDEFCGLADPFTVVTYPVGAPSPEQLPSFFRVSSATLHLLTSAAVDLAWSEIQRHGQDLVLAYQRAEQFETVETTRIGDLLSD